MSRAYVVLRTPDDRQIELTHGDFVGRLASARLVVDDPRVSEAHAMVSLREGVFWMLALRRMVAVDGKPVSQARLEVGTVVCLAEDLPLHVDEVVVPATVLGIESDSLGRRTLPLVASVLTDPLRFVGRFVPEATAHVWSTGEGWHYSVDGDVHSAKVGGAFSVGEEAIRFVHVPTHRAGATPTRREGALDAPLRIVASFDTVEIHREGQVPVTFGGLAARIISELVAFDGPVAWQTLARELWPEQTTSGLRHKWDVTLGRLRTKLQAAHVRTNLVSSEAGQVQLLLGPHDRVEDRT